MADLRLRSFTVRLAGAIGASATLVPLAAGCGGNVVVDGTAHGATGSGASSSSTSTTSTTTATTGAGASGTTTSTSTSAVSSTSGSVPCLAALGCPDGANPGPAAMACFTLEGGPCPDAANALPFFANHGCLGVTSVQSACVGGPPAECCYNVMAQCFCVGRPFVLAGATIVALPVAGSRAWSGGGARAPDHEALPNGVRRALAAAFVEDALGEHASVASFARLALELLALGAPSDLVAAAHDAALDEVRHARLAFDLAARFGGEPVGPSELSAAAAVELRGFGAFVHAAVIEGAIAETLAAILAAERAATATDPAVRATLESIAEDEARHAELAWRILAWAVRTGGDEARRAAASAFATAAPRIPSSSARDLGAFGLLDAEATTSLLARSIAHVIAPLSKALLDAPPVPATAAVYA